jgi:hypothetical protein
MNLWVRPLGQLALLAVALFFFSCEDETSTLGYKNPNSKFKVSYVEIPIESSVILRDSLRTSNFTYSAEPNRLLVGAYADEVFGQISASAFTQFFSTTPELKVASSAVYDSVTLQLQFDLYHYGSTATTPQTISIYELADSLDIDSLIYYFNDKDVPVSASLGSTSFSISPTNFDELASGEDSDTVITVTFPLNSSFGQRLFNSNVLYRDGQGDNFNQYDGFRREFMGIAIKADVADKVVGFSPVGSRIRVHYHEADKDSLILAFGFAPTNSPIVGFNQIKSDRAGTVLDPIKETYKDALQENDKRYIQSGIGFLTKLDFNNFYKFTDTVPYAMINSAELVIESVEASNYVPPSALSLRVLDESNNRMKRYTAEDAKDLAAYQTLVRRDLGTPGSPALVDNDDVLYAVDRTLALDYSSKENKYSMVMSLFLQQLAAPIENKTKYRSFVLHPAAEIASASNPDVQSGLKSVNRVIFPKDKIRLKIFYTKPTAAQ